MYYVDYNMYIYNMQCTYIICKCVLLVHLILCSKWLIHLTVSNITLENLKIRLSVRESSDFSNSQTPRH